MVSIIIHGSAIAILALATGATWISITFCGNLAHKLLFKLVSLPIPAISDFLISVIEKFPISAVVCLISLGYGSCGGIALMVTCVLYFILVGILLIFEFTIHLSLILYLCYLAHKNVRGLPREVCI